MSADYIGVNSYEIYLSCAILHLMTELGLNSIALNDSKQKKEK